MATRFYFSTTVDATNTPAFSATWEVTDQAVRHKLQKTASGSTHATTSIDISGTSSLDTELFAQFILPESLAAQTISGTGTFDYVMKMNSEAADGGHRMGARIFSSDFSTVRATLLGVASRAITADNTTLQTEIINDIVLDAGATVQAGDRLVIELGYFNTATVATMCTLRWGDNGGSDFALTEGLTTDLNSWVEFSHNFEYQSTTANQLMLTGVGT